MHLCANDLAPSVSKYAGKRDNCLAVVDGLFAVCVATADEKMDCCKWDLQSFGDYRRLLSYTDKGPNLSKLAGVIYSAGLGRIRTTVISVLIPDFPRVHELIFPQANDPLSLPVDVLPGRVAHQLIDCQRIQKILAHLHGGEVSPTLECGGKVFVITELFALDGVCKLVKMLQKKFDRIGETCEHFKEVDALLEFCN